MADVKIVNANIKRNHLDVKGSSYIPLGEDGITDSIAISVQELALYIGNKTTGYTHYQNTPSATWIVNHGLGDNPVVTVIDSGNTRVYGRIDYDISKNKLTITFGSAFSGIAICKI